jgi:hypothetical protein
MALRFTQTAFVLAAPPPSAWSARGRRLRFKGGPARARSDKAENANAFKGRKSTLLSEQMLRLLQAQLTSKRQVAGSIPAGVAK